MKTAIFETLEIGNLIKLHAVNHGFYNNHTGNYEDDWYVILSKVLNTKTRLAGRATYFDEDTLSERLFTIVEKQILKCGDIEEIRYIIVDIFFNFWYFYDNQATFDVIC